jgi:two-component system, OmpR family, sensor histidine kinase ArlS
MNIRFKITLLFTLLVMGILSLVSYSVYYFTESSREEIFKIRLLAGATNRASLFSILDPDNRMSIMRKIDSNSTSAIAQRALIIYDGSGKPAYEFYGNKIKPFSISTGMLSDVKAAKSKFYKIGDLNVSAIYHPYNHTGIVVFYVGNDEDGKGRINDLKQILLVSMLAGVIVTLMVGYVFSSQLVRPINRIIKEVNEISFNNLSDRIYGGKGQDELSGLANTFNNLLNRLQESITIQRRFISNASHELSTPLTSISSQLQVTLQKERSAADYQVVLQSIQEDVEQMRQLTKSLLEIAKTGYEGGIELSEVRIDEIMLKIVADVKKINAAYNVELEFGEFPDNDRLCLAYGNPDLLYSALKNITENGCKYSPDKHVYASLQFYNKQIVVQVKNYGEVISPAEIENIFHPFYRGTTAADTKGFGLGLALSKRIIALHRGEIKVQSVANTGTVFIVSLPSLSAYYPK